MFKRIASHLKVTNWEQNPQFDITCVEGFIIISKITQRVIMLAYVGMKHLKALSPGSFKDIKIVEDERQLYYGR